MSVPAAYNVISLFAGVGGFDYAAQAMGWNVITQSETNEFCVEFLKECYPGSTQLYDIKKIDFTKYRGSVDIICGGFPCQPYSVSGKRKGKEDDRHLFPEMLRAIREVKPRWVVGENVRGIVSWNRGLVFEEVQADLEVEGYEVWPFILPACGVDAPHRRDRVWFVAFKNSNGNGWDGIKRQSESSIWEFWNPITGDNERLRTDNEEVEFTPNSNNKGLQGGKKVRVIGNSWSKRDEQPTGLLQSNWRNFPTQSPICSGDDGFSTELLRQRIREDSHGLLSEKEIDRIISKAAEKIRKESIKAAGNAVVPQLVLRIFQAIQSFDKQKQNRV